MCGGTLISGDAVANDTGLSPRVRGNRESEMTYSSDHRTIPACAGEPKHSGQFFTPFKDYPRVCGGTCERAQDAC